MRILFYFWIFFFCYVNSSIESCKEMIPISVKNCTDIKITDKIFCCLHSYLKKGKREVECFPFAKNNTLIEEQIIMEESIDYDDVNINCMSKYIKMSLLNILVLLILFI